MASLISIPLPCLKGIWQKATDLFKSPGNIVPAPGHPPSARMAADCFNFKSMVICSHVVAVANLNECLPQFISSFSKSREKPNFRKLVLHGMPSGTGRKVDNHHINGKSLFL